MTSLLEDILKWKTECENTPPPLRDLQLSITITPEDLVDLRKKFGVPTDVIIPGHAGKIFGVDIYVQEEASQ